MNFKKLNTPLISCELKFDKSENGIFTGYASKFGGVDAVDDTILKGAFGGWIEKDLKAAMFVNHDSREVPVGDWKDVHEDDHGLVATGQIDLNHKDGPTVYSALLRKAMDALSIGFLIPSGGSEVNKKGVREIKEIDLKEISIVNFPADDAARISVVKSQIEALTNLRGAELFLRESGFSRAMATKLVSHIKDLWQSDSEIVLNDKITKLDNQLKEKGAAKSLYETILKL